MIIADMEAEPKKQKEMTITTASIPGALFGLGWSLFMGYMMVVGLRDVEPWYFKLPFLFCVVPLGLGLIILYRMSWFGYIKEKVIFTDKGIRYINTRGDLIRTGDEPEETNSPDIGPDTFFPWNEVTLIEGRWHYPFKHVGIYDTKQSSILVHSGERRFMLCTFSFPVLKIRVIYRELKTRAKEHDITFSTRLVWLEEWLAKQEKKKR